MMSMIRFPTRRLEVLCSTNQTFNCDMSFTGTITRLFHYVLYHAHFLLYALVGIKDVLILRKHRVWVLV